MHCRAGVKRLMVCVMRRAAPGPVDEDRVAAVVGRVTKLCAEEDHNRTALAQCGGLYASQPPSLSQSCAL